MKQLMFLALLVLVTACAAQPQSQYPTQPESKPIIPPAEVVPTPDPEVVTSPASGQETRTSKVYQFVMTIDSDGFDPRVLTVPWSERVKITLSNEDIRQHSFDVAELGISKTLAAGETVVLDFVPATKGDFKIDDKYSANDGNMIVGGET